MSQANAEHGHPWPEAFDHLLGDSRLAGRAGPGRNNDPLRLQLPDLFDGDLIVARDTDFQTRINLAQSLDEVVGERVVVIQNEDHQSMLAPGRKGDQMAGLSDPSADPSNQVGGENLRSPARLVYSPGLM